MSEEEKRLVCEDSFCCPGCKKEFNVRVYLELNETIFDIHNGSVSVVVEHKPGGIPVTVCYCDYDIEE